MLDYAVICGIIGGRGRGRWEGEEGERRGGEILEGERGEEGEEGEEGEGR